MRTHLSKCSCNQTRQDEAILPRNSKIETILLFHYMFISSQLWLTSHPRSTVVLLGTGTLDTSGEILSEDADCETRTRNPLVITDALAIELNSSKDIAVRHQLDKLNSFSVIAFELFSSVARAWFITNGLQVRLPSSAILLFLTIFGSAKCKIFGGSGDFAPFPPPDTSLGPCEGLTGPPDLIWIRHRTDRANTFFDIHIGRVL